MSTLAAALAWAKRGFPVFPLQENSRRPAFAGVDWTTIATRDEAAIRALWTDPTSGQELNYNIGAMCNDFVVVDIDVKNGKKGLEEFYSMGGKFDTLTVATTTGGYHLYYYGPESSNASISDAVDIRSWNGYVVAPGSSIDGIEYKVVQDQELSWIPQPLERLLKPRRIRAATEIDTEVDNPAAIQAGLNFALTAPPAIEGALGDNTTFVTAARLTREFALSVPTAFAILRDHWNPRCSPPWDWDELYQKVENAAAYGTADHGRLAPETLFGDIVTTPPPSVFEQVSAGWGNALNATEIKPRPWLMNPMLMKRAVTLLVAAGSAGKSSLGLTIASHVVQGIQFADMPISQSTRVMVYNGEDDLEEQSRRLVATCTTHGFDYQKVKSNIILFSARDIKMVLATKEGGRVIRNEGLIDQLRERLSSPEIGLLILDPLVKLHSVDESDNVDMDFVMEILTDLAYDTNTSILVLHHTSKGGNQRQEDRVGNMDITRGASAIINAARIAFTLLNPSTQDLEDYGIDESQRNHYVRLDDAKMNLSLASATPRWFVKRGEKIEPSGDVVGTLRYKYEEKSIMHMKTRALQALADKFAAGHSGSIPIREAVAYLQGVDPLLKKKQPHEVRSMVMSYLSQDATIAGRVLKLEYQNGDFGKPIISQS